MVLKQNTKHLLSRAAFGPRLADEESETNFSAWFKTSTENKPIQVVAKPQITPEMLRTSRGREKQQFTKSRDQLILLNSSWINQLPDPSVTMREKVTLFWHDHFACRIRSAYLAQQQNNTLRKHAVDNFRDLLYAVSKDPGMLQFLNNQQNKKESPNENFAREVLELFTLGRGHYSEMDIKESARAFTGWAFNPLSGEFSFRDRVHDNGVKIFRGKNGRFSGEDILDIILEDRQTARFITEKIWHYFVSAEIRDEEIIALLADKFYDSGYQLPGLLSDIFSSTWFCDPRFVGNRIKSPVELMIGIVNQTGGEFQNYQTTLFIQRALSQVLLLPPNVSGWPGGTAWIDSSSLMLRMSLPSLLLKNKEADVDVKDDGDANNVTNVAKTNKLAFTVDWDKLTERFMKHSSERNLEAIEYFLLARPATAANRNTIGIQAGKSLNDKEFIQKAFIGFMSLPEYQLS